jgi:hypothetical protein
MLPGKSTSQNLPEMRTSLIELLDTREERRPGSNIRRSIVYDDRAMILTSDQETYG